MLSECTSKAITGFLATLFIWNHFKNRHWTTATQYTLHKIVDFVQNLKSWPSELGWQVWQLPDQYLFERWHISVCLTYFGTYFRNLVLPAIPTFHTFRRPWKYTLKLFQNEAFLRTCINGFKNFHRDTLWPNQLTSKYIFFNEFCTGLADPKHFKTRPNGSK